MAETTQTKAVLKRFIRSRHPSVDALTVYLGVKSIKSIMKMDKLVIKEIQNQLGDLINPNDTAAERVHCGIQTMQAIDSLEIAVHDLTNRGIM